MPEPSHRCEDGGMTEGMNRDQAIRAAAVGAAAQLIGKTQESPDMSDLFDVADEIANYIRTKREGSKETKPKSGAVWA